MCITRNVQMASGAREMTALSNIGASRAINREERVGRYPDLADGRKEPAHDLHRAIRLGKEYVMRPRDVLSASVRDGIGKPLTQPAIYAGTRSRRRSGGCLH